MKLYLIHGTANQGRTHFCGVPVRATGKAAAMKRARAAGLAPRGIREVTRMPDMSLASDDMFAIVQNELLR